MLFSEFQLDQLHENVSEKDARTGRRRKDRGKAKADVELGLICLDKFFDSAKSDCVEKPGEALCQNDWSSTGKLEAREFNRDTASSSQGWRKDTVFDVCTRRLVATEEDQEHLNFPEDSICTSRLVASGNSETAGKGKIWPHILHMSKDGVTHMEKDFSIVRQRYGLSPTDQMKDLHVNTAIWNIFMSVTFQAAVHLWKDYTENLRSTKNQPLKSLIQLFQVTERLITDQTEFTGD